MNNPLEPQKSLWKKSWKSWPMFFLLVAVATFVIIFGIGALLGTSARDSKFFAAVAGVAMMGALVIAAVVSLIRWLCSWRNLRKALFGLACVATLLALFYAVEDVRGKWAWNHFQRTWEAKGEYLDLAHFNPAPVPDDQNFALTPIMVSTYGSMIDKTGHEIIPHNTNLINRLQLNIYRDSDDRTPTNGHWMKGTLTDLQQWQMYYRTLPTNDTHVTTNEFPTSPQPQSPARDVLLALSKYDSTIEELRQASRMPYSRFPLEYDKDDPAMILLPHLAALKRSAQCLQLRAIAEVQAGQSEQAAADIKLANYLTQASQSEPFFISHLVRLAMLSFSLQPIYEGLAQQAWSDAQLAAFDADLAKFDFLADYQRSMRSEAAGTAKEVAYIQRTRKVTQFVDMFTSDNPWTRVPALDALCFLSPSGWFHQNQIRFAKFYLQECIPVVDIKQRQVSPKAAEQAQANLDETTSHPTPYNAFLSMFYVPVKKWFFDEYVSMDKFARGQASVDLARVAIALERYKLAHGNYPESLDVLAPQFLQKLPHDVIGGQPLKYRRTNDSFVLYSVGWNGKDDGGVAVLTRSEPGDESGKVVPDADKGDWVWAYPAK